MKIKTRLIEKMKTDDAIKTKLMHGNGKSYFTIMRWINGNLKQLTTIDNVNLIAAHYNIPGNQITTKE